MRLALTFVRYLRTAIVICGIVGGNLFLGATALFILAKGEPWVYNQLKNVASRAAPHSQTASTALNSLANTIHKTPAEELFDPIVDVPSFPPKPPVLELDDQSRRIVTVGPKGQYTRISEAAKNARDGDIIRIAAGTYTRDSVVWIADDLLITGYDGIALVDANNSSLAEGKAIWVIRGDNYRVENIGFTNAKARDRNGAGIRSEGANLTVRNCFFHDNETALLASPNAQSSLLVEHSELARNGHADGQAHQIYVGKIKLATLRFNYIHHATVGSSIKSRAHETVIKYNRILDGTSGTGNYSVDISDGGRAIIIGNTIQQSAYSNNYHIISFAPESRQRDDNLLIVAQNTIANDRDNGVFIRNFTSDTAYIYNNFLLGKGTPMEGPGLLVGNVHAEAGWLGTLLSKGFDGVDGTQRNLRVGNADVVSRQAFDYRPTAAAAVVNAGVDLDAIDGIPLAPEFEYEHPLSSRERFSDDRLDVGAFEYRP